MIEIMRVTTWMEIIQIDDGLMESYYSDSDGDGYGDQIVEAYQWTFNIRS